MIEDNNSMMKILIVYFIFINFFTFVIYGVDKEKAKKDKYRISEFFLLFFGLVGGFIGALFGMKFFHHKTKKFKFYFLNFLYLIIYFILYFKFFC